MLCERLRHPKKCLEGNEVKFKHQPGEITQSKPKNFFLPKVNNWLQGQTTSWKKNKKKNMYINGAEDPKHDYTGSHYTCVFHKEAFSLSIQF